MCSDEIVGAQSGTGQVQRLLRERTVLVGLVDLHDRPVHGVARRPDRLEGTVQAVGNGVIQGRALRLRYARCILCQAIQGPGGATRGELEFTHQLEVQLHGIDLRAIAGQRQGEDLLGGTSARVADQEPGVLQERRGVESRGGGGVAERSQCLLESAALLSGLACFSE